MEIPFFTISAKNFEGIKQPFESLLRSLVDENLELSENLVLSPTEIDPSEETKDAVVEVIQKAKSTKKVVTEVVYELQQNDNPHDETKEFSFAH